MVSNATKRLYVGHHNTRNNRETCMTMCLCVRAAAYSLTTVSLAHALPNFRWNLRDHRDDVAPWDGGSLSRKNGWCVSFSIFFYFTTFELFLTCRVSTWKF
jgi:hypothetical protein